MQPENEKMGVYAAVNYIKKNRVKYKESLLLDDRYVYQGLPEEYLDEVVKRIPLAISKKENYPQAKKYYLLMRLIAKLVQVRIFWKNCGTANCYDSYGFL